MSQNRPKPAQKYGREPRYRFILNPHPDVRCTRCPECEALTRVRKVPLLIHIEPHQLITLRKSVRVCPGCDLLIVHRDELERELVNTFLVIRPEDIGNPYMVLGTVEVADWKQGMREPVTPQEMIARHHPFREELELRVRPGGWFPAGETPPERPQPPPSWKRRTE